MSSFLVLRVRAAGFLRVVLRFGFSLRVIAPIHHDSSKSSSSIDSSCFFFEALRFLALGFLRLTDVTRMRRFDRLVLAAL